MRSVFSSNKQLGTSILELMIASSLLAVIGIAASAFFKRVSTSDMEARAKSNTISEITLFLSTIERDFKLREVPGPTEPPIAPICMSSPCKDFSIKRIVRVKSTGKDAQMNVSYTTICVAAPGVLKNKFENALSQEKNSHGTNYTDASPSSVSNALNGACFKSSACKSGFYPQVVITPEDLGADVPMPSYPRLTKTGGKRQSKFPNLNDKESLASGVVGAVLCGQSSGTSKSDRLILEAAYMNSEGQMRIEKREVSIPRSNVANIQMLPSN